MSGRRPGADRWVRSQTVVHPGMKVWPGDPYPLGATATTHGVNFALYSEHAVAVELCLFADPEDAAPSHQLTLEDRTGPVFHGFVPELTPGWCYGYRVHGPYEPAVGARFNPHKILLDPYARALGRPMRMHPSLFGYDPEARAAGIDRADLRDNAAHAPLAAVIDGTFDWNGDRLPDIAFEDTVIYETHVRGLTMLHPGVPAEFRGTYLGLATDAVLEHLVGLGISAVQLLPVHAVAEEQHLRQRGLVNYWGYNTLGYFAPEPRYAMGGPVAAVTEFKTMVKRLHSAGIEVILDVVFNHTGEGNSFGPTLSFRGIDNLAYYKSHQDTPGQYVDYTGTGNTLDPGNPFVLQLMMDSLRYWVQEMHVDGFRFDLASALTREVEDVDMLAGFLKVIQQDPLLSRVKLIAEPWDVGPGGYQVGNFPWHWCEWNGRYRDTVRAYWRGDLGSAAELATRVAGSSDLYGPGGRRPFASVNFVTSHDGFTLADLVSYEGKHNELNGEGNADGESHNLSSNGGVEGVTDDAAVLRRRDVRRRSLFATLMLSQGVPMILGGDEIGRSQGGNNNGYAQDNAISWLDWHLDARDEAFLAFCRNVMRFRLAHPVFRRRMFLSGLVGPGGCKDVTWFDSAGLELEPGAWGRLQAGAFGMQLCGLAMQERDPFGDQRVDETFLVLFHGAGAATFVLPKPPLGRGWSIVLSTCEDDVARGASRARAAILPPGSSVALQPDGLSVYQAMP